MLEAHEVARVGREDELPVGVEVEPQRLRRHHNLALPVLDGETRAGPGRVGECIGNVSMVSIVVSNSLLKSSKIDTQPRLSVKPRLCTCNIEARMLKKKRTGSYKLRASSKSKASTLSPNYILRTSSDDVTHFFFHSLVLGRWHLARS